MELARGEIKKSTPKNTKQSQNPTQIVQTRLDKAYGAEPWEGLKILSEAFVKRVEKWVNQGLVEQETYEKLLEARKLLGEKGIEEQISKANEVVEKDPSFAMLLLCDFQFREYLKAAGRDLSSEEKAAIQGINQRAGAVGVMQVIETAERVAEVYPFEAIMDISSIHFNEFLDARGNGLSQDETAKIEEIRIKAGEAGIKKTLLEAETKAISDPKEALTLVFGPGSRLQYFRSNLGREFRQQEVEKIQEIQNEAFAHGIPNLLRKADELAASDPREALRLLDEIIHLVRCYPVLAKQNKVLKRTTRKLPDYREGIVGCFREELRKKFRAVWRKAGEYGVANLLKRVEELFKSDPDHARKLIANSLLSEFVFARGRGLTKREKRVIEKIRGNTRSA